MYVICKMYYHDGQLLCEINYINGNGNRNSIYKSHDDGQLLEEVNYIDRKIVS